MLDLTADHDAPHFHHRQLTGLDLIRNFWYAIALGNSLKQKHPLAVSLMGHELVLYRDQSGRAIALDARCRHRGTHLAGGWVENDCLHCPYHGWRYGSDGACQHIPANAEKAAIPRQAHLKSYPVREAQGLIWLFWGDAMIEDSPGLPPFAEYTDPQWRTINGSFHWDGHYSRVIANTIDMAHAPFVHATAFGRKEAPQVPSYQLEAGEWTGTGMIRFDTKPAYSLKWILGDRFPEGSFRATFYLPNITRVDLKFGGIQFALYLAHVPINSSETITLWQHSRNFLKTPLADFWMAQDVKKTFLQDNEAVRLQSGAAPVSLSEEAHAPSDALEIAYRKCLHRAMGMQKSPRTKP
ncbi:MAG: aromatic ring-hydroxylating dioxygenase subunit alpha [Oscillatoriales cyanobacterium SM2_2_1]|nr:aromatic ring-hydroxylating dioxygenase subunit alpha [Oscillatoriales cyanobacterium SM2_2_1]